MRKPMKRRETSSDRKESLQDHVFSLLPVMGSGSKGFTLDQVRQVLGLKGPNADACTPEVLYRLGCQSIIDGGRVCFFRPKL